MSEKLTQLLKTIVDFDTRDIHEILSLFKARTVKRNTLLLREGQICREFYFVSTGCLRTYFIDTKGNDKTRLIMPDCWIGTALTSFITREPSLEYIEVLEDSEIMAIDHTDFYRLNATMPAWKEFYQKILEMAYAFQNRRIAEFITISAPERYKRLMQTNPVLIQKVSNRVLASYLDVAQETLSRIKSEASRF